MTKATATAERRPDGRLRVVMPLPPSNNDWLKARADGGQRKSGAARRYTNNVAFWLSLARKKLERGPHGFKPMAYWTWVDVWMVLPQASCDSHNYYKIAFDTLQKAKLVADDKYILDNLRGIGFDRAQPAMVLEWAA